VPAIVKIYYFVSLCYTRFMTEERLNAIETTLAYQEQQITDLSAMISAQWKEIERLQRLLSAAHDKIQDMEAHNGAPPANVRPPHY
jgi:SlyX protein